MTSSPTVDAFVRRAMRIPLLSREDERVLLERYQRGDMRAGQRVVTANLRFALKMARRFASEGPQLEDLVQEANVGLLYALPRFRLDFGVRFVTYAKPWVMKFLLAYMERAGRSAATSLQTSPGETLTHDGQRGAQGADLAPCETWQDRLEDPSDSAPERIESAEELARIARLVASVAVREGAQNADAELRRRLRIVAEELGAG